MLTMPTEHGFYWVYRGREPFRVVEAFPSPPWPKAYVHLTSSVDLYYKKDLELMGVTRFGTKIEPS